MQPDEGQLPHGGEARFIDSTVRTGRPGRTVVQTIKTAAIVVLLMTVMYGAYVSLTTPPEPLPDEVHQMLVESDDFDIDAGFPESLDAFGPPTGLAEGSQSAVPGDAGAVNDPAFAQPPDQSLSGVSQSLSDQGIRVSPGERDDLGNLGSTAELGGYRLASRDPMSLPAVDAPAPTMTIERDRQYPSTGGSFALPDPQQMAGDAGLQADGGGATESGAGGPNRGLANAIATADEQYHAGKKKEALATLSLFYDTPKLTSEQRAELVSRLDPLAREVIYSQSHLLEQPRRVRHKETLSDIAEEYEVPSQLLANINGIDDPLLPGTDLKVVRGPFRADVSLGQQELTLFVGDYYAGRFPVAVGSDPVPEPGSYTIQEKQTAKTFYDTSGNAVPPDSPNNPFGSMWLDLGGRLCIHGSPSSAEPTKQGCISLSGDHASDLYGILSQGSAVVIRR
jgi:lipoprotein-anchoring transpeptidase ErfK/SrfK